ncbi:MAG: MBL fold metallo-hydrolase [Bacteroidales bacterium]|nr:MBL fold metallo-hydrolase [Bacteroidales bacterium]
MLVSLTGCTSKSADTFTLWQLPSYGNDICNSYVIQTSGGKLIVMDGGYEAERHYLRGYIDALGGGKVDAWFISHPHPDILTHYNDHSMVIRVWDDHKSMVFLGDLGVAAGRKLMASEYMKDVDCDYLQVAHHGQRGCDKEFYMTADFKACLWPTPKWVYDNDLGKGFNTAQSTWDRHHLEEHDIGRYPFGPEGIVDMKVGKRSKTT